jgi:NAD(P)-dependent dehydrogenase (short-subunit alcohol dehydrogenase family)
MELKGKIVVITGASRGLGKALAERFLEEGSEVTLGARSNPQFGTWVKCDVTKEEDVANLAEATIATHGRIDIWINNAGVRIPHTSLQDVNIQRFHDMMEVNLFGTVYGAKVAVQHMKEGIILSVLSTAALEGRANATAYTATKFAQVGFLKALRAEVPHLKVVNVYPGGMKTNFFDEQMPANYHEYMDPASVAEKIVANLKQDIPEEEQIIKRPQ